MKPTDKNRETGDVKHIIGCYVFVRQNDQK